jgi:hypothetical protein
MPGSVKTTNVRARPCTLALDEMLNGKGHGMINVMIETLLLVAIAFLAFLKRDFFRSRPSNIFTDGEYDKHKLVAREGEDSPPTGVPNLSARDGAQLNPLTQWRPLSDRASDNVACEALHEGVPAHLLLPLLKWLEFLLAAPEGYSDATYMRFSQVSDALALRVANRLRIDVPGRVASKYNDYTFSRSSTRDIQPYIAESFMRFASDAKGMQLLDIIDAALAEEEKDSRRVGDTALRKSKGPIRAADLDDLLKDGGSAYRVNADGTGLERRVDVTVTDVFRRATDNSAVAGSHLKKAWKAAYGLQPNPTTVYAEATKAIEAALIPVILPGKSRATLGDVLRELRDNKDDWELAIADRNGHESQVTSLHALAELVWHGHRDRHSGTPTTFPVSTEAAEMALHVAAMIVHWVDIGGIRRRSLPHSQAGQA